MNRSKPDNGNGTLPLWRLLTATFILGGMVAVLLALAPVYLKNYRLQNYLRDVVSVQKAAIQADDQITTGIMMRARDLGLPVETGDIHLEHEGSRLRIGLKYKVQRDFGLYQVDLHFRPEAANR